MPTSAKPRFFASPATFGHWLETHHDKERELVVGFWKVHTGKPSMTWAQSVEQALRFGWIDGVRWSIDEARYCIRFTPRKPTSNWSLVNVRTMQHLRQAGLVAPAGLAAYQRRTPQRTGVYSAEQAPARLTAAETRLLKADRKAWMDFQGRPPHYQKAVRWWIVSAKKPSTRARRLATLLACSRAGEPVPQFRRRPGNSSGKSN